MTEANGERLTTEKAQVLGVTLEEKGGGRKDSCVAVRQQLDYSSVL